MSIPSYSFGVQHKKCVSNGKSDNVSLELYGGKIHQNCNFHFGTGAVFRSNLTRSEYFSPHPIYQIGAKHHTLNQNSDVILYSKIMIEGESIFACCDHGYIQAIGGRVCFFGNRIKQLSGLTLPKRRGNRFIQVLKDTRKSSTSLQSGSTLENHDEEKKLEIFLLQFKKEQDVDNALLLFNSLLSKKENRSE